MAGKSVSAFLFNRHSGKNMVENIKVSPGMRIARKEKRIDRQ